MKSRRTSILLLLMLLGYFGQAEVLRGASSTTPDPSTGVEQGREALRAPWGSYRWYDEEKDAPRSIKIQLPLKTQPSSWNWNWSIDLSFLGLGIVSFWQLLLWLMFLSILGTLAYFLIKALRAHWQIKHSGMLPGRLSDRTEDPAAEIARIEALPIQLKRKTMDPFEEAMKQYSVGNFREAIIYLYSHRLIQLDKRQLIRLESGKTNRQYIREIRENPRLRNLLEETMTLFEDVFFGNHDPEPSRFRTCWNEEQTFQSMLQRISP